MKREFRLRQLLREHAYRPGQSWAKLARDITEAHAQATGRSFKGDVIRRGKLKAFVEGADVPWKQAELEALDDYLRKHHQGLAYLPIFSLEGLLPSLASMERVDFLVGTRETQNTPEGVGTIVVSHFDLRAHTELVRALNDQGASTTFGLDMVLLRSSREEARGIAGEAWEDVLTRGKAVISIASPIANHATERMLAGMFGVPAYEPPHLRKSRSPLEIVLPEEYLDSVFSSFVNEPGSLSAEYQGEIHHRCWALRLEHDVYVAGSEDEQNARTYGIVAAQRRTNGQLWVVAAGLHGAGTHAAALAIPDIAMPPESVRPNENGHIHVHVVEAEVTYTKSPQGTKLRKVERHRVRDGRVLEPIERVW